MNPQLCDTPVPYYENEVPAGIPTDPGDIVKGDYIMLLRELLKWDAVLRRSKKVAHTSKVQATFHFTPL